MFLPPIPRLAAWIVAGLVCWQWSSVYGESGRRNLAFQGHVGSIRVHRHVSFSPQDSSVELHRLHSLRYHLRRRSASERPTQRLAPPPPTLPEVLPPPTPPKKKPRGQNVPGLPKWYTWRSVTEGHQYGLDKDEVLREHAAPKLDCGIPAPKYKFYVYPLDIPERCNLDKKNLTSELFRSMGSHSQWLDEVFFYHQMLDHPWRTFDPSEAYLFYVPILTTLSSTGYCGDWKENMRQVQAALQASPWYHRYSGADHLMFATNKNIREYCADHPDFADMVKNFIVGRQLYWVSEFPDQCSIAVPHSSQMAAKGQCNYQRGKGSEEPNILYCESDLVKERDASFEAYKERRNYTMFCMGQADDRPTHTSRKTAIDNLSELRPPNYLLGVGVKPASKWRPDCQPGQVSGCHFGKNPNADDAYWAYRNGLHQSKFSIFARGDDPASSRMYDALELGVPQMMLSDLYMGLVAAFQCKVDWDQLVCKISEEQFNSSPVVTMSKVLDAVMGGTGKDPEAVWRQMWEATMNYRDDLLWSSKNSRVGHNLLEEIGRRCTTGARKGIWDSYSQRKKEARR